MFCASEQTSRSRMRIDRCADLQLSGASDAMRIQQPHWPGMSHRYLLFRHRLFHVSFQCSREDCPTNPNLACVRGAHCSLNCLSVCLLNVSFCTVPNTKTCACGTLEIPPSTESGNADDAFGGGNCIAGMPQPVPCAYDVQRRRCTHSHIIIDCLDRIHR